MGDSNVTDYTGTLPGGYYGRELPEQVTLVTLMSAVNVEQQLLNREYRKVVIRVTSGDYRYAVNLLTEMGKLNTLKRNICS